MRRLLLCGGGLATAILLSVLPAGGAGLAPEPQALVVGVALEPQTLAVGDLVKANLSLTLRGADATREATFPDWSHGWGDAEVLSASKVERTTSPDGVRLTQHLKLTAFRPGTVALPPVEVRLAGEPARRAATAPGLALEIRSVIAADDKELKAAPPSPPRSLAVPRTFWWSLAAGCALVALAGVIAWRNRAQLNPLAAPELSPSAELERALGLLAAESPSVAFVLLSQALRRYLGRRLAFRALESTTTEVQRKLARERFDLALVQSAVRLLRLADQIKFALRPVEAPEVASRIGETRELAAAIERHLAPAADAALDRPSANAAGSAA